MFGNRGKESKHNPSWNSSHNASAKVTTSSILPWKKSRSNQKHTSKGFSNLDQHSADDEDIERAGSADCSTAPATKVFRQVKVNPLSRSGASSSQQGRRNGSRGDVPSDSTPVSPFVRKESTGDNDSSRNVPLIGVGAASSNEMSARKYLYDSSPASSYRRSVADDDGHRHLISYDACSLDDMANSIRSSTSECGGSIRSISNMRSQAAAEDDAGDGWSIGVRRFQVNEHDEENSSVFMPSHHNVASVASSSYVRDSLLKKEFNSIKSSISYSFKKYRDKKKHDNSVESTHAVAYQYVDKWLKKKKVSSSNSRISKNEFEIYYHYFIKKIQAYFAESGLKVINYDTQIEELLENKFFEGKIDAYNFLMKINLNDDGMISLNDFVACLQSCGQDLNVTNFKIFVKKMKKSEEKKQKLDEVREKAREEQRQKQMMEIEAQEAARRAANAYGTRSRKGSVMMRRGSMQVNRRGSVSQRPALGAMNTIQRRSSASTTGA